jgi:hypothetical protein
MNSVCLLCDRSFRDNGALQQHKRNSPAHAQSFDCGDCIKSFGSAEALRQHLRDSLAHAYCTDCSRLFGSEEALQQHLRYSPAHAQSSGSEETIEQPLQDSPAHAQPFDCEDCNRPFGSEEALKQHLRDSPAHHEAPETPLDTFFRSFHTFQYDPSQPPATSYARLEAHKGWRRSERNAASSDAWNRYQHALEDELRLWFGEEDDLAAWHALCHAIGVEPPPQTCERCEQV